MEGIDSDMDMSKIIRNPHRRLSGPIISECVLRCV